MLRCKWPRGKVLGGSSVLNYMLYVRGNKRDFDLWASENNTGWSYDDVLPYFKKSEDNRNPYIAANTKYHSTGGYLTIQEPAYRTPMVAAFVQGGNCRSKLKLVLGYTFFKKYCVAYVD